MKYSKDNINETAAILLHSLSETDTDLSGAPYQSINMLAVRYFNALIEIAKYTQSPVVGVDTLSQGLDMLTDIIYTADTQEVAEKMLVFRGKIMVLEATATNLREAIS